MTWIIEKISNSSWIISETRESSSWTIVEIKNIIPNISEIKNDAVKEITETISIWDKYLKIIVDYLNWMWPKLIWAILVLIIWFKIINFLNKIITKYLEKTKLDPMVKTFSISFVSIILKIMVFLSAAWMLWVETTSFLALFTAAWVAIWMSLSWTLQNFAWGMIILAFKLYKIWDFVSIWWNEWTVKWIHIFHTVIITLDRKTVIIPNSQISNWTMINFSTEEIRRLDMSFWVDYKNDINLVKKVLIKVAESNEKILKDDEHEEEKKYEIIAFVNELRESCVWMTLRFFVNNSDLIEVKQVLFEEILKACKENNIKIAHPIREIFTYEK